MEDIGGGLHPAVDGQSLDEDEMKADKERTRLRTGQRMYKEVGRPRKDKAENWTKDHKEVGRPRRDKAKKWTKDVQRGRETRKGQGKELNKGRANEIENERRGRTVRKTRRMG